MLQRLQYALPPPPYRSILPPHPADQHCNTLLQLQRYHRPYQQLSYPPSSGIRQEKESSRSGVKQSSLVILLNWFYRLL